MIIQRIVKASLIILERQAESEDSLPSLQNSSWAVIMVHNRISRFVLDRMQSWLKRLPYIVAFSTLVFFLCTEYRRRLVFTTRFYLYPVARLIGNDVSRMTGIRLSSLTTVVFSPLSITLNVADLSRLGIVGISLMSSPSLVLAISHVYGDMRTKILQIGDDKPSIPDVVQVLTNPLALSPSLLPLL